jgi:xylulokinase
VGRTSASYPTSYPSPGFAEQDPRDWLQAVADSVRALVDRAGIEGAAVEALAIAAQVDAIVAVDAQNHPLGPAPIWMDRRAASDSDSFSRSVGAERLRAITGLNPDASHGAPKIAWLRREIDADVNAYLVPASFLVATLTGARAVDPANASSLLLFDIRLGAFSRQLLDAIELPGAPFGEVATATAIVGTLNAAAAASLGLTTGCKVAIADISGTAEPVAAASNEPVVDPTGLLETHAHVPPDRWLIENPGFVSAGSARWLAEQVIGRDPAELESLAAAVPPGADGVLFLPALGGAVAPRWDDRARGAFLGLAAGHDQRHLARAVFEGCTYALRDSTDRLRALGLGGGSLRVVGGGARNTTWLQIKADVTGLSVELLAEPEATALGAALIAAVGAGWYPDLDIAAAAHLRLDPSGIEPNRSNEAVYADGYATYRASFDALWPAAAEAMT